ncbi:MAG: Acidobacterial duplicated orphan permease (function unknown) [uncultured Cytophagales bacterium]|uniref:ABC transporter, permease protein n=1 Tax=uncultured Cytophagales bacterium TaxID=158755 RepID=A0A6J4K248_9SPHI|nr:MAG: Acidobacterial duplicated orphan permease (function unknown) [uncultured Cytophagales bacterium]
MLYNYLKVALRALRKRQAFTFINMAGLAFGIAAFLLILQYVAFEWNTNRFHRNGDRIYRVVVEEKDQKALVTAPAIAATLKQYLPDIASYTRVAPNIGNGTITYLDDNGAKGNNAAKAKPVSLRENRVLYVDDNFLDVFTFPVVKGRPSLPGPQTMALSESQSRKYFGDRNPLGKVLVLNNRFGSTPYTVTAVFKDVPANSDLQFDVLLSLQTLAIEANRNGNPWADPNGWDGSITIAFLTLKEGADAARNAAQATMLAARRRPGDDVKIWFQPLSEIHLAPSLGYHLPTTGQLELVLLLTAVSVLVLTIAWVNYVNLATAHALDRAREVGIRKVVGAGRGQLVTQYLLESLLLNAAGLGLALLLVNLLQPGFNAVIGKPLSLGALDQGWFLAGGLLFVVLGTLVSGGYVAVVLSAFQPIVVLKGTFKRSAGGALLRKGLVVFQFSVSILFIVGTFVLYRQLGYMRDQQRLGMNLDQLLVISGPSLDSPEGNQQKQTFQQELSRLSFVEAIAISGNVPGNGHNFNANGFTSAQAAPGTEKESFSILMINDQYLNVYGIKLLAGTNFTPAMSENGWEQGKMMVNESAARLLGYATPAQAVGKTVKWGKDYEIVGVVQDYHHASMRDPIAPTLFLPDGRGNVTLKMSAEGMPGKLARIGALHRRHFPADPFEYFFADENYDKQYQAEKKLGQLFTASSVLAVCIACLGLFGLAAYMATQRAKEIGIRKVMGASTFSLVRLLSADFLKLVVIAFVVAVPVAWYAVRQGLQHFAYQIPFPWWIVGLTGLLAFGIALATVSFQSIKLALTNPSASLRSE